MYDISANRNTKSTFFGKQNLSIVGTENRKTITFKAKKCNYSETYILNDKKIWSYEKETKGTTKGKLIINSENIYKYI